MRSRMIAFSLVIIAVSQFPALPGLAPVLSVLLAAAGLLLSAQRNICLAIAGACIAGLGWGLAQAQQDIDALLPQALEGHDFWVSGRVRGLPQSNGRAQQFAFWVQSSCFEIHPAACTANKEIFSRRLILLNYYGPETIAPGQSWRWRVRLNRPHGFVNPGGFDYEAWLILQGYAAKGYIRSTSFNQQTAVSGAGIDGLRWRLRLRLQQVLVGLPHAGSLLALILGDREQISQESWALFTATGTNHLIVISGLHVGFIAWLAYGLGNGLARLSPRLLAWLPAQRIAAASAIGAALAYSLLAGFSLPTQRAVLMVGVFMGAQLLAREYPRSLSYCIALSAVLVLKPMSPVGAGFWLSFGAVGTLLLAFAARQSLHSTRGGEDVSWPQRLGRLYERWLRPQWVVFIGMSVPLLAWTQQVSLLAPLANLFAVPLVSLFIVPIALLAAVLVELAPAVSLALLGVADWLLELLRLALQLLSNKGAALSLWQGALAGPVALFLSVAATLLLLLPKGWPGRYFAVLLFLPLLWPAMHKPAQGDVELWVLDVGQGLAVVVRSANHVLVYDTGPAYSASFNAGSAVILPFLRQLGIDHIDHLVVSHGDLDHQGGLAALLQQGSVGRVTLSTLPDFPVQASICARGQQWRWDGVSFTFLLPLEGAPYRGNDSSCVLRIDTGGQSALLSGDIESAAEAQLVQLHGAALRSSLLLAPHHGSASSSSGALLAAVRPVGVVFSAGYRSQFGHPAPSVSALYEARGVKAWNTAISGALRFELSAATDIAAPLTARELRVTQRRYWYREQNLASKRLHGLCAQFC